MPTLTNWSEKQIKIFVQILNLEKASKVKIINEEKKVKISPFFSQFWLNFGHFRANLTQSEISGVFGQNFVPEILKISVGLLSKISDILRNF